MYRYYFFFLITVRQRVLKNLIKNVYLKKIIINLMQLFNLDEDIIQYDL